MSHPPSSAFDPNTASGEADLPVRYADVQAAAERLEGIAHRTPIMTSGTADEAAGAYLFLKCENLQRTGAFKFRGAYNALARLAPEARARGVLTYSSGNHAQALALAGRLLGVPTTIIMPTDAPALKRAATEGYGATVIPYDREATTREALAAAVAAEHGLPIIPPYDHPDVVAGQGTAAKELFEDAGPLDVLLVCCGGGGLLSGSALAARALAPQCRVVGVEPEAADDATRSFYSGTLHHVHNPDTIADGARTPSLGGITFPIVQTNVDAMVTVPDAALRRAMRLVFERMKLVTEPTGVLALAAALEGAVDVRGARVGVLISGGNVEVERFARLVA